MSLRYEQYAAVKRTHDYVHECFIRWCWVRDKIWWCRPLRKWAQTHVLNAYRCLRHFPLLHDSGKPIWSQDNFTEDK